MTAPETWPMASKGGRSAEGEEEFEEGALEQASAETIEAPPRSGQCVNMVAAGAVEEEV